MHGSSPLLDPAAARVLHLVAHTTDMLAEITPDGRIAYASEQARELLGLDPAEIVGRDGFDFVHPDDALTTRNILARALASGRTGTGIYRVRHRERGWRWVEATARPFHGADGDLRTAVLVRDVTAQRRMEETLRAVTQGTSGTTGAAFFRSLVENVARAFEVDAGFVAMIEADRAHARTIAVGGPAGLRDGFRYVLAGSPCENVVPGDVCIHATGVREAFPDDELVASGGIDAYVGAPLRDATGQTIGILGAIHTRPLPDPALAESLIRVFALRASAELERWRDEQRREELLQAVEQAGDATAIFDQSGRAEYVNAAFERLVRCTRDRVIGRTPEEIEAAAELPGLMQEIRAAVARQGSVRARVQARGADGSSVAADLSSAPVRDTLGHTTRRIVALRDVTRELALEEEVRQAQRLEAVGTLAGGIAHDFNNLLTGILGHASLLQADCASEHDREEAARVITTAAERAAGLTRQLLGFAGRAPRCEEPVDLHRTIDEVMRLLHHTIPRSIRLVQRLEATLPCVKGDPGQMQQWLLNLALNARDAMPDGGELVVHTRNLCPTAAAPRGRLEVVVQDTGVGIPDEIRHRIFEPFFTTKGPGRGSGMGLAVVYGVVRSHGGTIRVDAPIEGGTAFHVLLPVTHADGCASELGNPAADAPRRSARVLVVDDEPSVRHAICPMLDRLGHQADAVAGGREAVERLRARPSDYDLVLLDVDMPGMDGIACFRALRALEPNRRVLLFTGLGRPEAVGKLEGEGLAGVLAKPCDLGQLGRAVEAALAAPAEAAPGSAGSSVSPRDR